MGGRTIIGVDWGSTNLRAFRFAEDGAIAEVRRTESGARTLRGGAFEAVLYGVVQDWLNGADTIIVTCGMAGGREGWREAPYVACPADMAALAGAVIKAPAKFADVRIAPGAKSIRSDGRVEVMRGEETQILGGLEDAREPALVVAPGTHSKWTQVEQGRLLGFRTYMTGELFAILKAHSILGRTMQLDALHDAGAFDLGVERALEDKGLLNLVFSARTERLFDHIAPHAAPSYLSGVLIGAEIVEATVRGPFAPSGPLFLIGDGDLVSRYARALELAGCKAQSLDGERAAARGLWRIAQKCPA